MILPVVRPAVVIYSERVGGRVNGQYQNCVLASACASLRFMGYRVPGDFTLTMRRALGFNGPLSFNNLRRAMALVLPQAPLQYGQVPESGFLQLVRVTSRPWRRNNTRGVVVVTATMSRLPRALQKWVGYEWINEHPRGKHAIAIAGQRNAADGSIEVLVLDPMGNIKRGYKGQWAPWAKVSPALVQGSVGIKCVYGVKGAAVKVED